MMKSDQSDKTLALKQNKLERLSLLSVYKTCIFYIFVERCEGLG